MCNKETTFANILAQVGWSAFYSQHQGCTKPSHIHAFQLYSRSFLLHYYYYYYYNNNYYYYWYCDCYYYYYYYDCIWT